MKENRKLIPDLLLFQEGPGVRNTQYTASGVKLLNVANLVDGTVDLSRSERYISEEEAYGKYSHFMVEEGDFIIASSGIKVEYFDKKMGFIERKHLPLCMNTSTIRFKTLDKNRLDIRYFMYFLKSNDFKMQLHKQITGSAQLNFGPTHLKRMTVPIIEISKQKKIVKILDILSSVIKMRNQQLSYFDELIKSRFVEMFGDIKSYPSKTFKECTNFIDYRGKTPTLSDDGTIKMINAKSVGKGLFKKVDEYVTKEVYDEWMKRGFPKGGDVLFVTEGHTFGNVCRIPEDMTMFALGQRVITIQGNPDILDNIYLATYMQFQEFKSDIESYKTGSSAQGIRSKELIKIQIPLPDYNLQLEFANIVRKVDKLKVEVQKSLDKTQVLFDSLMQQYFE